MTSPALLGWLAAIPLLLLQWAIVIWYALYWDLFPKRSLRRLVPWAIFMASVPGILILQVYVHVNVTGTNWGADDIFKGVLAVQNIGAGGILIYLLNRRKRHTRLQEEQHSVRVPAS